MSVTNSGSSSSTNQSVIDTDVVHAAGKNICNSVQGPDGKSGLKGYVDERWTDFHNEVQALPLCLQNDFNNFYNNHKPKLDNLIENRNKIGQTLQKSADLWEFQETVTAKNFSGPNIYAENNYYTSPNETNPANQQRPKQQ